MSTIKLTKSVVEPYSLMGGKPTVTISKGMVTMNLPAVRLLNVKKGEYIILEIRDDKLYLRFDPSKEGMEISNAAKSGILNAYQKGIGNALKHYGFNPKGKPSIRFHVGEFKEGARHLIPAHRAPAKEKQEKRSTIQDLANQL